MKIKVIVVIAMIVMLSSCVGYSAITGAQLSDTVFSVEPRQSGYTTVWFTHDDVGAYCTRDSKVADTAIAAMENGDRVVASYRSLNTTDSEYNWTGLDGCASEKNTTIYLLTDLYVPSGDD